MIEGALHDSRCYIVEKVPAFRSEGCLRRTPLEGGQQLAFLPKDGSVLLVPVPRIDELIGIVKVAEEVDYRERTGREERY
jgi:hypothetical protein